MDLGAFFKAEFAEHHEVARRTEAVLAEAFAALVAACAGAVHNGGKLLFFGNGGSAADAQHLTTELTVRYKQNRKPIAAIALTTDTSALTAAGNDLGFEAIFARQIEALGRKGDVAVGISTSGTGSSPSPSAVKGEGAWEALPITCWSCPRTRRRVFRKCTSRSGRCCAGRWRWNWASSRNPDRRNGIIPAALSPPLAGFIFSLSLYEIDLPN